MTIKEIAKLTNLSISTVSKALNNQRDVSEKTKEIVLECAKKYGYKSKEQKILERNHMRFVIIHSNMGSVGNTNVLYPVSINFLAEAKKNQSEILYYDITDDYKFNFNDFMKKNKYDGALIIGVNYLSPIIKQLEYTKYPVVLHDNLISGESIATIGTNNISTMIKMFNYLYDKGHRKIAFVAGEEKSFVSIERFSGYIIGLKYHNLYYDQNLVYWGDFSKNAGIKAADFLEGKDFTAVMCSSDLIAIGIIERFKQLGKKIPHEISVTGFDDFELADNVEPKLTTIHQDFEKIGRDAYNLLAHLVLNKSPQRIILDGNIVERNSVKDLNNNSN